MANSVFLKSWRANLACDWYQNCKVIVTLDYFSNDEVRLYFYYF